jgi:diguanylate cyclase (GGDEF)-like protein
MRHVKPALDPTVFRDLVDQAWEGIAIAEPSRLRILHANRSFCSFFACPPGERRALHRVLSISREDAQRAGTHAVQVVRPDGGWADLEVTLDRLIHRGESMIRVLARDVTARKQVEERTRYFAYHDTLTGLPNRLLFRDRLELAMKQGARAAEKAAVFLVDLDRFKQVNDTFGHDGADEMLSHLGARLCRAVRVGDTVARQGGDEFLVLVPRLRDHAEAATVAERLCEAIRGDIVPVRGREVRVTASVGVSLFPDDGADVNVLLHNADTAMYRAKSAGRDGWHFYDPRMEEQHARVLEMRTRLHKALANEEFLLHFQPEVSVTGGRIVSVEALLRWQPPGEALVPPLHFIPVAEDTGLIMPIGDWVLRNACHAARRWLDASGTAPRVAVNLSARQFRQRDIVASVRRALQETGLPPEQLELEVTESVAVGEPEHARAALTELKELGVSVAIDDFGTGYSSLALLHLLPFDRLKVDRSFLRGAQHSQAHAHLVRGIVSLGHSLGLEVVAEGVETPEQFTLLEDCGCDVAQGFGIARPMPGPDLERFLRAGAQHAWGGEVVGVA